VKNAYISDDDITKQIRAARLEQWCRLFSFDGILPSHCSLTP